MEQTTRNLENANPAKFAFYYLLSLVALIFTAVPTGIIIFQIINKNIPDVLSPFGGQYNSEAVKFAISAVIIAAPVYYFLMRLINKNLFSGMLSANDPVRRWLTYFIQFVASVVVIGWLIGLINSFLNGELTIKFILKALTAIGISAVVFTYYLHDIRRAEVAGTKDKVGMIYFYATAAIVVVSLIAAFVFVESPAETRDRKYDSIILQRFSQIDSAMNDYYNSKKKLPENLEVLAAYANYLAPADLTYPDRQDRFGFNVLGEEKYQLCADFKTSNRNVNDTLYDYLDKEWIHDNNNQCFIRTITSSQLDRSDSGPAPVK